MFHMYVGVRAGGGIGDEIEDPAGDEYEIYRIIFDITFFFFVIVILLAIIQGKPTEGQEDPGSDLLLKLTLQMGSDCQVFPGKAK